MKKGEYLAIKLQNGDILFLSKELDLKFQIKGLKSLIISDLLQIDKQLINTGIEGIQYIFLQAFSTPPQTVKIGPTFSLCRIKTNTSPQVGAGGFGKLTILDLKGNILCNFKFSERIISSICSNGSKIIGIGNDGNICIWDLEGNKGLRYIRLEENPVFCLDSLDMIIYGGGIVFGGGNNSKITMLNYEGNIGILMEGGNMQIRSIRVYEGGEILVVGGLCGGVQVLNTSKQTLISQFKVHSEGTHGNSILQLTNMLFIIGGGKIVSLVDISLRIIVKSYTLAYPLCGISSIYILYILLIYIYIFYKSKSHSF